MLGKISILKLLPWNVADASICLHDHAAGSAGEMLIPAFERQTVNVLNSEVEVPSIR